jgi:antitoxin MazE
MIATVRKWGNSLGVRIPRPVALDAAIGEGTSVDMRVRDGQLVITPAKKAKVQLSVLLKGVKSTNVHREIDTGTPVGGEVW